MKKNIILIGFFVVAILFAIAPATVNAQFTWKETTPTEGIGYVYDLIDDGGDVYACSSNGVYKLTGGTSNWQKLGDLNYCRDLIRYGNYFYAAAWEKVYKIVRGGNTWEDTDLNLTVDYGYEYAKALAESKGEIYVGTAGWMEHKFGRILKLSATTGMWEIVVDGMSPIWDLVGVSERVEASIWVYYLIAGAENGVYEILPGGTPELAIKSDGLPSGLIDVGTIDKTSSYFYVGLGIIFEGNPGGVYRAGRDAGISGRWTEITDGLTNRHISDLYTGNLIYAGTRDGVFAYKTLAGGNGWENIGLKGNNVTALLWVSNYVYAGTGSGKIFRTDCADSDGGIDFNIKGKACDIEGTYKEDFCTGSTLTEYYCKSDGKAASTTVYCDLGCEDGRCKFPDQDEDGVRDDGDNCPNKANRDQKDYDADGKGDVCDNCKYRANSGQEDIDNDGEGNACDCDDVFQGPYETGVDCGGDACSWRPCVACTWCGNNVTPIRVMGPPNEGFIDVVFVPETSYQWNMQGFINDAIRHIRSGYFQIDQTAIDSIPGNYKNKFNFYRYTGGFGAQGGCAGELPGEGAWQSWAVWCSALCAGFWPFGCACLADEPSHFWGEVPFTDSAAILFNGRSGGCAQGFGPPSYFISGNQTPVVIHESAHSIFGVVDEYCGDTYYEQQGTCPNVWSSLENCSDDATNAGWTLGNCRRIKWNDPATPQIDCQQNYWRYDPDTPDPDFMTACGPGCTADYRFYEADTRRLNHVFNNWPQGRTKGVLALLNINNGKITEIFSEVVESHPDVGLQDGPFRVEAFSSASETLDSFEIWDPRIEIGTQGGPGMVYTDNVNFTVMLPFYDNLKTFDIEDAATGETLVSVNLSKALNYYCDNDNYGSPECQSLDLDDDGIKDSEDNCPLASNSNQEDADADGEGDACDPVANANGPYVGNESSSITFNGSSSSDPDGTIVLYEWDLDGDGQYDDATETNPVFTWNDDYSGNIGLKVTDNDGLTDTASTTATVLNVQPSVEAGVIETFIPDFVVFCTSTGEVCEPGYSIPIETESLLQIQYSVRSTHCSSIKLHVFIDGTLIRTTDFLGWPGATGEFAILPLDTGLLDLGPVSSGSHLLILQAEGQISGCNYGQLSHWGGRLKVLTSRETQITNEGSTVNFSGSFTDPSWLDTHTIKWDFKDGTTASGTLTPSHVYYDNGVYAVTLTVTDDDGGVSEDTLAVTVNNVPPVASAANDSPKNEGTPVTVTASQVDPGADTFTYSFDWNNDGIYEIVEQISPSAQYTFTDNGIYIVGVKVKDDDGGIGTVTTAVTILDLVPTAEFIWNPEPQNEGSPVQFTDKSSSWPDALVSWNWSFGDSGTSSKHTYGDNGVYLVTLTVIDDDGSATTISHPVTVVNVSPIADAGSDQLVTAGDIVKFSGSMIDPGWLDVHTYEWDFDASDGIQVDATGQTPTHIYYNAGAYTVTLTVTDDDKGVGTDTLLVEVKPIPANVDCDPDTLNLKSNEKWITCYIELPVGYDVRNIDATTILLNGAVPPELNQKYGFVKSEKSYITDHGGDGILERMIKFDRFQVQSLFPGPVDPATLTITGKVSYNTGLADFEGSDVIKVIAQGK